MTTPVRATDRASKLPNEILAKIFRYCSWEDRLFRLSLVNNQFQNGVNCYRFDDVRCIRLADLQQYSAARGRMPVMTMQGKFMLYLNLICMFCENSWDKFHWGCNIFQRT